MSIDVSGGEYDQLLTTARTELDLLRTTLGRLQDAIGGAGVTVRNQPDPSEAAIIRAIGVELRLARESLGWSRERMASALPSGLVSRTIQSYEYGQRNLTALRLIELCRALDVDPGALLSRTLQRAEEDQS
jgi:hypothetical protein